MPLHLPEEVQASYRTAEQTLQRVLRSDQKLAQKILSAYLGLLTVYPDQPYDHPAILHPLDGTPLVEPESHGDFQSVYPKEETVLEIVRQKLALGQKVLIYTSWTVQTLRTSWCICCGPKALPLRCSPPKFRRKSGRPG